MGTSEKYMHRKLRTHLSISVHDVYSINNIVYMWKVKMYHRITGLKFAQQQGRSCLVAWGTRIDINCQSRYNDPLGSDPEFWA